MIAGVRSLGSRSGAAAMTTALRSMNALQPRWRSTSSAMVMVDFAE
jgi:hypothetical protein